MRPARLGGARAVWVLTASVAAAAALMQAFVVPALTPVDGPFQLPWWGLAAGFALCELAAVRLSLRRSAHTFATGELALVIGLVLAAPRDLVIAQVLGPALVVLWRRTPLKAVFDLARLALGACVALLAYHAMAPSSPATGPAAWAAALGATTAACLAGGTLLTAALSVADGEVDWGETWRRLGLDLAITVCMTSVGLAFTTLLLLDPRSAWLLVLPAVMLVVACRGYLGERRSRERLAFLYDATHALALSSDVEVALHDMLTRCRAAFRADLVEAVLLPAGASARRSRICPVGGQEMAVVEPGAQEILQALAADGPPVRLLRRPVADAAVERYLASAGVRGPAMLAVLEGAERPLGLLLIANRPEVDRPFGGADLDVLAKLAGHAAASLAHDSLEQDFGRLELLQGQLERMAFHDPLTELANRARFTEQVRHSLGRRDSMVAALFIDLDDFKTVNDSMGHKAGDELLVAVAGRLRQSLRTHDTPARLGGDEFAVLIEAPDSMDVVIEIAERVLDSLNVPFSVAEAELTVRASIGVATSLDGVHTAEDLVRNADLAMYRAKSQGKGCIELFQPEMHVRAVERHELKAALQHAVDEDQFSVLFQPVVDLQDGQIAGVEALVRWKHPRLGLVGPDEFVPLAEEAGLIDAIGRLVFTRACLRLAAWRQASIAGDAFTLALNLSVREFQSTDLVDALRSAASAAGVPTSAITLEITESALMDDLDAGVARMEHLKAAGFRLALDDFGMGYSPLGHLRRFPIDVLKIAKPFVDHIAERAEDAAFLGSILDLARTLSLEVVVEGVETPEQARILLRLGAARVQGFVFSPPVEDRALSALLTLTPLRGFAEAPAIEAADPDPRVDLITAERRW